MDVEPSIEPGSRWLARSPAPALSVTGAEATLEAPAGTVAWLLASPRLGFAAPASGRVEGILLLDRTGLAWSSARLLAGGRARWALADAARALRLQALVLDSRLGRLVLSDVR